MMKNSTALHVLVIAHPDDESMFFVPTLTSLRKAGQDVWILCLTNGDYDGLGKTREKELHKAAELLDISKVILPDNDFLKDHPTERWPIAAVSSAIERALLEHVMIAYNSSKNNNHLPWDRIVLTTFDKYGVSGHVNHIDTHNGVQELLGNQTSLNINNNDTVKLPIEAWQLESHTNWLVKYVPVWYWIAFLLSLFHWYLPIVSSSTTTTNYYPHYTCLEPWINWSAMKAHASQFVWYRRLFVIFSVYTYSNKLLPMIASQDSLDDEHSSKKPKSE